MKKGGMAKKRGGGMMKKMAMGGDAKMSPRKAMASGMTAMGKGGSPKKKQVMKKQLWLQMQLSVNIKLLINLVHDKIL